MGAYRLCKYGKSEVRTSPFPACRSKGAFIWQLGLRVDQLVGKLLAGNCGMEAIVQQAVG